MMPKPRHKDRVVGVSPTTLAVDFGTIAPGISIIVHEYGGLHALPGHLDF
jgi:hypothetical protein